jgi:predicted naringenin-chalcone synthase
LDNKFSNPCIQSVGIAVPPNKISQSLHHSILESANGMSRLEKIQLKKIYSRSGINTRHSVLAEFGNSDTEENILFHPANHHPAVTISKRMQLFQQFASELCELAVKDCFKNISVQPKEVTHLITFSCTGMSAPGLDIQLVESLGLNRNVERTCINFMGCYAGINALKVAYHIARSQPESIVLLAGVELCTLHYQKNDKQDQLVANALFADGAAACLVSSKEISSIDEKARLVIQNFYSEFEPAGKDEMIWTIGDTGFDLRLSTEVPELIRKNISALIARLMTDSSLKNNQIDFYAIHPGGMKILEACENALGISKKQNQISYDVLSNYGNMSSVTIFFVLKDYLNSFLKSDDGKKILACAFGPGLTMESMIAEVCFSH